VPSEDVNARRREILDAALAIADEQGLGAVTMRAVAARVGLTPMALYPHVGGKDGLLDGIVERLLAELLPALRMSGSAEERLRALARALRGVARRHPSAFPLMLSRPSVTPESLRELDAFYQALLDVGVPPEHVPRVERLLSTFGLGFAASEVSGRFGPGEPRTRRTGRAQLDPAVYPAHTTLTTVLAQEVDWDAEYEADLDDLAFLILHRWSTSEGNQTG
jgi:AcrR family transcriptional regulator